MNIKELRVMRGPNFWSVDEDKLIVTKIHFEKNKVSFDDQKVINTLIEIFPNLLSYSIQSKSVKDHFISNSNPVYLLPAISLELQTLAGMTTSYSEVVPGNDDTFTVVFSYQEEQAGVYAIKAAVNLLEAVLAGNEYSIEHDVEELTDIRRVEFLGLSTGSIVDEAKKRGIPYMHAYDDVFIILGYGANQKRIQATIANTTGYIGVDIAGDKDGTKRILKAASIPIPEGVTVETEDELIKAIKTVGYPLVTKPLDGNHGRGITLDIKSFEQALEGFRIANEISETVIIERYVTGHDYRILLIDYKFVAAVKRSPASIIGDGRSTIQELIEKINSEPRRQKKLGNILQKIEIDDLTKNILKKHHLTLQDVLESGRELFVKETGNVSSGAIPIDVTDQIHPYNIFQSERIARLVGLDICGIDVMSPDMAVPLNENGGAVIEVNAAPGIRMHMEPAEGLSRNVAGAIVDMLFPEGHNARIPIVAVTGTNGKTTATRLVAHIAKTAGMIAGYTTTEGIYINDILMESGDCSGPQSARYILKDTTVEFAVLECARGGILRAGLAFNRCDVGIVTNVSEDHLGLNDINSLEEMAKVKSVIPRSVHENGYAVLNAEDDLAYEMKNKIRCKLALFALTENNSRIKEHVAQGGLACYVKGNIMVLNDGGKEVEIEDVKNVPVTFEGKARFMVQNTLPAIISGYVQGFSIDTIREALRTFESDAMRNPGRLNIFEFPGFKILLDYAHNPAGLKAVSEFINAQEADWNIGITAAPGDRRDEDIRQIGQISAEVFDHIIIRDDDDLRGRTAEKIHELLIEGVRSVSSDMKIDIVAKEAEAIQVAIQSAKPNTLITIFSEHPSEAIKTINSLDIKTEDKVKSIK